jgi:hypothetical protein
MERFKGCQALVPPLLQPGVSIEKKLAEFEEHARTYPPLNRALAAIHFYLHFALWECEDHWHKRHQGIKNFATFLYEIDKWRHARNERVCFVTFNYDTMLEKDIFEVAGIDIYTTWENYSLFKLHGSVNWGRVVRASFET